jgi:hypothetical protein
MERLLERMRPGEQLAEQRPAVSPIERGAVYESTLVSRLEYQRRVRDGRGLVRCVGRHVGSQELTDAPAPAGAVGINSRSPSSHGPHPTRFDDWVSE